MTDDGDEQAIRQHLTTLTPNRAIRVLVTGSRDWSDEQSVISTLNRVRSWWPPNQAIIIVHGNCPEGADAMADAWANNNRNRGAFYERHPAQWRLMGYNAGMVRNTEMVALGADICVAFIRPCSRPRCNNPNVHESHGTHDCYRKARAADIPVWRVRDGF